MYKHLQEGNAGNLGDYLKHFLLIELLSRIIRERPSSIAYIDTHAGTGKYTLKDQHWENRAKYRRQVCSDEARWLHFDRLNPRIEIERCYLGSFVLVGRSLSEEQGITSKRIVCFENDPAVAIRIKQNASKLLPEYELELHGESSPDTIRMMIQNLRAAGFEKIVCLIDPYWKAGKQDAMWCPLLDSDEPDLFVLLFDATTACGKDAEGHLKFTWHCGTKRSTQVVNHGIKGYAVFSNSTIENLP